MNAKFVILSSINEKTLYNRRDDLLYVYGTQMTQIRQMTTDYFFEVQVIGFLKIKRISGHLSNLCYLCAYII